MSAVSAVSGKKYESSRLSQLQRPGAGQRAEKDSGQIK
jgi:hypothetical protein